MGRLVSSLTAHAIAGPAVASHFTGHGSDTNTSLGIVHDVIDPERTDRVLWEDAVSVQAAATARDKLGIADDTKPLPFEEPSVTTLSILEDASSCVITSN